MPYFKRIFPAILIAVGLGCFHAPAAAQQSSQADELAQQGQQAMQSGQLDKAEAAFTQLAKLQPTIAEIPATLGVVYFQANKLDLAIESLRHALRLKPSLAKARTLLAICLSETGKTAEALPGLDQCFHSPADPEQRRVCGLELLRAYTALHRDPEAVATGLALQKLYPDDPEILYQSGRVYANFAYLALQKLQDKAPDSVWAIQSAAEADESRKNYNAALQDYNHVLAIEPHRPGIHYRIGRVYLARFEDLGTVADRDSAKTEFASELDIDPGNANAAYELANILTASGDLDNARKLLQQVTARFPDFEEALVALGGIYLDSAKPELAIPALDHATRIRPADEVAWYRLAHAQHALGNSQAQAAALAQYKRIHTAANAAVTKSNPSDTVSPQTLRPDETP